MRTFGAIGFALALACGPLATEAGSTNATLAVSTSIVANCILTTNVAVEFGTYNTADRARGGPLDVTAQAVSIACTKGAPGVSIALGEGEYANGSHRGLGGGPGTGTVSYDIYTSQERSTVWNTINTVKYAPQTSRSVTIPLYGRIPAGQSVTPGRYSDVLLAMVNF